MIYCREKITFCMCQYVSHSHGVTALATVGQHWVVTVSNGRDVYYEMHLSGMSHLRDNMVYAYIFTVLI